MLIKLLIVNILTFIRVVGTAALIPIYKIKGGLVAGIFSLVCYLTDSIDGILARHWKVSTFFGALFDGIADKLFTIINFIVLYLITPFAIIPIIFEILTVLLQVFKFNKNYNIKSNIIGKSKVWVLAICLVLTFIVSDISNATLIPLSVRESILNIPNIYLYLMLPAMLIELITFISYVIEIFKPSKKTIDVSNMKEREIETNKKDLNYLKKIWFSPEFYYEHKNETNLIDFIKAK